MIYTSEYWNDVDRVLKHVPSKELLFGKRILITGATGMLCSCVVELLFRLNEVYDAGIKLILAGRDEGSIKSRFASMSNDYEFLEFDATQLRSIQLNVDYVIHGASNASPSLYEKYPVETALGNIYGTQILLELLRENQYGRMLYVSSSEVYGNREYTTEYKEEDYGFIDILNPRAAYPNAKRLAETLCVSYEKEWGVETVVARPGHVYGPTIRNTDSRATAQFSRSVVKGENIIMKSAGQQRRSYCYTLDCASALLTILINGKSSFAYNISNADSVVSIREWAEELAVYAGVKLCFEKPSDAEIRGYNTMNHSVLNAERLMELGWKPEFCLKEGIQRTVEHLRINLGEKN